MTSRPRAPQSPALNLEHLRKQAKSLLRGWRQHDPLALRRLRDTLPLARGLDDDALGRLDLRLHDAQSCIAREHGCVSWADLRAYVEAQSSMRTDRAQRLRRWLELAYPGDVTGTGSPARPDVAARLLTEQPELGRDDPYAACTMGDEAAIARAISADPGWVNRAGGPLRLPPLVAVAHSTLLRDATRAPAMRRCARLLLEAGADPDQRIGNRWSPASLQAPDNTQPLSALYGAAGSNHDASLTRMLLAAGADPNDGESLYHALGHTECTAALLADPRIRIDGTNALYHALDFDDDGPLELLLAHGADPNEPARNAPLSDFGTPLLWAIRRRRSLRHIELLLQAGARVGVRTPAGDDPLLLALQYGLPDIAALLAAHAPAGARAASLSADEVFVAACARGDEDEARRIRAIHPELPGSLPTIRLRLLPDLASAGATRAVRTMVALGWPIAVRGADWDATALNLAVFRGDADLTRFLLEHGAHWREQHGHGSDVIGTLSWASCFQPSPDGDWPGCAAALKEHGLPPCTAGDGDPASDWRVIAMDGRRLSFADDVAEVLLGRSGIPIPTQNE